MHRSRSATIRTAGSVPAGPGHLGEEPGKEAPRTGAGGGRIMTGGGQIIDGVRGRPRSLDPAISPVTAGQRTARVLPACGRLGCLLFRAVTTAFAAGRGAGSAVSRPDRPAP